MIRCIDFPPTPCRVVCVLFYPLQCGGVSVVLWVCEVSLCVSCLFIPALLARPSKGPDNSECGCQKMFPAESCSRRVSERHLWQRRQYSLPVSNWDTKELLFCCSAGFLLIFAWGVLTLAKEATLFCLFSRQNQLLLGLLNIYLYQSVAWVYFPFSLWFYCL